MLTSRTATSTRAEVEVIQTQRERHGQADEDQIRHLHLTVADVDRVVQEVDRDRLGVSPQIRTATASSTTDTPSVLTSQSPPSWAPAIGRTVNTSCAAAIAPMTTAAKSSTTTNGSFQWTIAE